MKLGSMATWSVLACVAVVSLGCGSRDKPAEPAMGMYGPPPDAGPPPAAPPPAVAAGDAGAADISALVSGALAQGAAILGAMAGPGNDPVDNGLKSMGTQQAPGMKPDGKATKLTLAPGAHAEASVTLRPGKCYTIVAFGGLGVQTLVIRLLYPTPMPAVEGVSNGPTATIGPKDQCVRSLFPAATPLKIDVEMKAGQGQVGVQTYSK